MRTTTVGGVGSDESLGNCADSHKVLCAGVRFRAGRAEELSHRAFGFFFPWRKKRNGTPGGGKRKERGEKLGGGGAKKAAGARRE